MVHSSSGGSGVEGPPMFCTMVDNVDVYDSGDTPSVSQQFLRDATEILTVAVPAFTDAFNVAGKCVSFGTADNFYALAVRR